MAGCSSNAFNSPATCSLVGLGLGTASGIGWAASKSDDKTEDWALGVGVGAVGGALVGYGLCALFGHRSGYVEAEPTVRTVEAEPELSPEAELAIYGLAVPGAGDKADANVCVDQGGSALCLAGTAPVCPNQSTVAAR